MRSRRTSTKRLFALLLTVLCVAARFQCIVCPAGGRAGGGGVGEGGGEGEGGGGAGAGEGEEGGEGAGGSRSGEEEGGSTNTYNWWGGATRAVAAGRA
nr:glycine-rich cell wall structural protein 2-like [Aegilops tauschii subsp. strangulata]